MGEAGGAGEVKETSAPTTQQGGRGGIGIGIATARKHAITATRRGLEGSLVDAGFTTTLRVSSSEVEDIALMETSRCWEHAETATVVVVPSVEEVERCAAGWAGTLEVSSQKVQQEDLEEWVLLALAAAPFVRIETKGAGGGARRVRWVWGEKRGVSS